MYVDVRLIIYTWTHSILPTVRHLKYLIKDILYATDAELIGCQCMATKETLNLRERMSLNERGSHSSRLGAL